MTSIEWLQIFFVLFKCWRTAAGPLEKFCAWVDVFEWYFTDFVIGSSNCFDNIRIDGTTFGRTEFTIEEFRIATKRFTWRWWAATGWKFTTSIFFVVVNRKNQRCTCIKYIWTVWVLFPALNEILQIFFACGKFPVFFVSILKILHKNMNLVQPKLYKLIQMPHINCCWFRFDDGRRTICFAYRRHSCYWNRRCWFHWWDFRQRLL